MEGSEFPRFSSTGLSSQFAFANAACCRQPGGPNCACAANDTMNERDGEGVGEGEGQGEDYSSECGDFGFVRAGTSSSAALLNNSGYLTNNNNNDLNHDYSAAALAETFQRIGVGHHDNYAPSEEHEHEHGSRAGPHRRSATGGSLSKRTNEEVGSPGADALDADAKKRKKVPNSCTNCKKSHLSCDEFRPCLRCARKGLVCVDSVPKIPAPRGHGPKAREKARLAELRKQRSNGHSKLAAGGASGFECTMDESGEMNEFDGEEEVGTPGSVSVAGSVSLRSGRGGSASLSRAGSGMSIPTLSSPHPSSIEARVAGIVRPSVTKLPRGRGKIHALAAGSTPSPTLQQPQQQGMIPPELLAQLGLLGTNNGQIPIPQQAFPTLSTDPSLPIPTLAYSNPMLPSLQTDLSDFLTPFPPQPQQIDSLIPQDQESYFDEDALSSIAPSEWTSLLQPEPQVPLSSLPDPIGFDIEDLGNSRFVDRLVFGPNLPVDERAASDAGSWNRSQGTGTTAKRRERERPDITVRKRSSSRRVEMGGMEVEVKAEQQGAVEQGGGELVLPPCFGQHGVDEVCEGCPFSMRDRFYFAAAGDTASESTLLPSTTTTTTDACTSLNALLKLKHAAGLLNPHPHAPGYAKLLRWLDSRTLWQPSSVDRIRTAVESMWHGVEADGMVDKDVENLLLSAEHLERLTLETDKLFAASGVPAIVCRRTGEVLRVNREFAALVGLGPDEVVGKWRVFELLDEASAVAYFEALAKLAVGGGGGGEKGMLLPVNLVNHFHVGAETTVACTASIAVHREPWSGFPCAVVANFLPLDPPSLNEALKARMALFAGKGGPKPEAEGADEEVRRLLSRPRSDGLIRTPPLPILSMDASNDDVAGNTLLTGMGEQEMRDEFAEFVDGMAF